MKKTLIFSASFLLLLVLIAMIPIPTPTKENIDRVKGLVGEIYLSGSNDIILKLVDDDNAYYINGFKDLGIDYTDLKADLLYQDVEIGFVKNWSIFGKLNKMRPVCMVQSENEVMFSVIRD